MEPTCCSKQFFFSTAGEIQAVAFQAVRLETFPLCIPQQGLRSFLYLSRVRYIVTEGSTRVCCRASFSAVLWVR